MRWESALVVALVAVIFGTSISSEFTSSYNLFTLCTNIGDLAIMALPMTLIIITGEIDLSVASTLALSAESDRCPVDPPLGDAADHHRLPGDGAPPGAINGFLVTRVGLPSLAVTIGTLTLYRGLANVILGPSSVSNFPPYNNRRRQRLPRHPVALVVGGDLRGARDRHRRDAADDLARALAVRDRAQPGGGVPRRDPRQADQDVLFVLSGVVCAAVGILYAFELSSAGENIGIGFELQVITIVLLGGVSIFGGKGTILGVALAAFVYAGLRSALLLTSSFNENDFQVVSGGLLILSVLIPNMPRSRRARGCCARPCALGASAAPADAEVGP